MNRECLQGQNTSTWSVFCSVPQCSFFLFFSFIMWWQKYVRARVSCCRCAALWQWFIFFFCVCCLSNVLHVVTAVAWCDGCVSVNKEGVVRVSVSPCDCLCFNLLTQSTLHQSVKQLQKTSNDLPVNTKTIVIDHSSVNNYFLSNLSTFRELISFAFISLWGQSNKCPECHWCSRVPHRS